MSDHRNSLLDLHPAAVAGSLLGARPLESAAARDAEPEAYEPRPSRVRRFFAALRTRRPGAARAEPGRA